MTDLSTQRRLSASILKCGVHRVWFDPDRTTDIQNAISREDLRGLIDEDAIRALQPRGNSRGRAREKMAKRCTGTARARGGAGERPGHGAPGSANGSRRSGRSERLSRHSATPGRSIPTCTARSTARRPGGSSGVSPTLKRTLRSLSGG